MATEGVPVERLRAYLSELKPEARALLVNAVERGALEGAEVPGAELILEVLRPTLRRAPAPPPRIGSPARLFFRPLEPFLVDAGPASEMPGHIERSSLPPLWDWIGRDLLPAETAAYSEQATAALLDGDNALAEVLANTLQDMVATAISDSLDGAGDDRSRRRVFAQVALPRAVADLRLMHCALRHRAALDRVAMRLPASISNLADEQLDNAVSLLVQNTAGNPSLLQLALVMVMNRLVTPWQLIRLAIRSADTDVAQRVAQSPLAAAVPLIFADIRCGIAEMREAFRSARLAEATALCRPLHDAIRAIRTEMDLSGDTPWSRELAALRGEVSELLGAEIEVTPGLVRRLLRPRPAREIAPGARVDATDVAEAGGRIELTAACRNYAGELAVNQIAPRVHAELRSYFDRGMPALIDSLRTAGAADRPFRQSQVEAAARLSAKLFGADYATLLSKAAAVALADPKAAKA